MYLLSLWEKGFATAAEPDENDAREAEGLRYELQQQEYADGTRLGPRASQHARSPQLTHPFRSSSRNRYALSQGSQQHLTYFNQQRGRLRALELRAYAQIDARYNGLLRRLSGCGTVLGACSDALKAMLPPSYRWSRAVNHLLLGHCWVKWRLLPADWAMGTPRHAQHIGWSRSGRGRARPRQLLSAELFDIEGLSHKAQAQICKQAREQGPAYLARLDLDAGETSVGAGAGDAWRTGGVAEEGGHVFHVVEDCLRRVDGAAAKIEELLDDEDGVPPPREPPPLASFLVHVLTAKGEKETGGGVEFLLRYIDPDTGMEMETAPQALGVGNVVQTVAADGNAARNRKKKSERAYGKEGRDEPQPLFQTDQLDVFRVQFAHEVGELVTAELKCAEWIQNDREWYVEKPTRSHHVPSQISRPASPISPRATGTSRS